MRGAKTVCILLVALLAGCIGPDSGSSSPTTGHEACCPRPTSTTSSSQASTAAPDRSFVFVADDDSPAGCGDDCAFSVRANTVDVSDVDGYHGTLSAGGHISIAPGSHDITSQVDADSALGHGTAHAQATVTVDAAARSGTVVYDIHLDTYRECAGAYAVPSNSATFWIMPAVMPTTELDPYSDEAYEVDYTLEVSATGSGPGDADGWDPGWDDAYHDDATSDGAGSLAWHHTEQGVAWEGFGDYGFPILDPSVQAWSCGTVTMDLHAMLTYEVKRTG